MTCNSRRGKLHCNSATALRHIVQERRRRRHRARFRCAGKSHSHPRTNESVATTRWSFERGEPARSRV